MKDPFQVKHELSIDFLRAELHTGSTFAQIALTSRDPIKRTRNLANARKAYESYVHYASDVSLQEEEMNELDQKREELNRLLEKLEEQI